MTDFTKYNEVMQQTYNLALATSVNNISNVRIISFCHEPANPAVIFFTTDRDNAKIWEFAQNPMVSLTTIPNQPGDMQHVRSQNAAVQKSAHCLPDLKALFITKLPFMEEVFTFMEQSLDVWEIHLNDAKVILDYDKSLYLQF